MANSKATGVAYSDPALSGGTIDDTVIGATTAAAGTFTALTATGAVALAATSAIVVGFYGAAGTAQRQASAMAAVATTAVVNSSASATCFGYTSAQATAIIVLVNELRAAAVALGLIAT